MIVLSNWSICMFVLLMQKQQLKKLRKKLKEIAKLELKLKLNVEEQKKVEDRVMYEERIAVIQSSLDAGAQGPPVRFIILAHI